MSDQANLHAIGEALQSQVAGIFDRLPVEEQPNVIVDLHYSDGVLLQEIYEIIRGHTARGRHLQEMPIRLVGVIDPLESGVEAESDRADSHPQILLVARNQDSKLNEILNQYSGYAEHRLLCVSWLTSRLVAMDQPHADVWNQWRRYFQYLTGISSASRFLVAEEHGLPLSPISGQAEAPADGCLDAVHRGWPQCRITAADFMSVAASQGFFNDGAARQYPGAPHPCRFSLHSFVRRDYVVRYALEADLDRLGQLEELCWQHTRTPKQQVTARLQTQPEDQFVLEKDGTVLGVLYSQRIASKDGLLGSTAANVHEQQDLSGPIVQLLAVNIDPEAQNLSYGDQLLEFVLQRSSLMTGITQVVGVTLCKHYQAGLSSFEEYIHRQDEGRDPVLAFHHSHGAEIVQTVPGYRPEDRANLGNGVLVAYDIANRIPRHAIGRQDTSVSTPATLAAPSVSRQAIRYLVQAEAAQLLNIHEKNCELDRPLMEMGLDSADLLSLQQRLEARIGVKLGAAFFFEHNSLRKVIEFLERSRGADTAAASAEVTSGAAMPDHREDLLRTTEPGVAPSPFPDSAIAIVGMSCKLPGGIESPRQLWQVLVSEECVIEPYPRRRGTWPPKGERPGIDQGGFVRDPDAFDHAFFRMSPAEAQRTDPQQRILLQLAWACLEDAGIVPTGMKGSATGVFVGASNCDYSRLIRDAGLKVEAHHGVGNSLALLANRLSYFFDFSGPSLAVDTACSSSLVALHAAMQSLRSGECAAALAAGVNLICHQDLSIAYHEAGMLAPDGRCKAFDAQADGYVRAEGAVLLLLKPLQTAVADGDQIHAVIRGSAINHGGLAGGLTVPNPQKQSELLQAAWNNAGIHPGELTYIEAHGTGTPLGDPIEVQGILSAFGQLNTNEQAGACGIGSVKSNLGHLESAAGITGLLKVVLAMQHRQLPASTNVVRLNPRIDLSGGHFKIQTQLSDWHVDAARIAGISSFGSGGANAHVVLQEYAPTPRATGLLQQNLFVLSAVDANRLREYAARVMDWLADTSMDAEFTDAIYTWQTGRTAMHQRLAVKVKDRLELQDKLRKWLAGGNDPDNVWSGRVDGDDTGIDRMWRSPAGQLLIEQALAEKNLEQLGALWISGAEVDWQKLHERVPAGSPGPRRISVPTYPFANDRHWIDVGGVGSPIVKGSGIVADHPAEQTTECLCLQPMWRPSLATRSTAGNPGFAERHVVLCELSGFNLETLRSLIPGGHCSLLQDEDGNIAERYQRYATIVFENAQSILLRISQGPALLQVVVPCDGQRIIFAGLSGLLKTAALESSHFFGQMLLAPPGMTTEELVEQLGQEAYRGLDSLAPDALVKYEYGMRHVLRWEEIEPVTEEPSIAFKDQGVYLITGGLGGLGRVFTSEILDRTRDARVVLTGRSAWTPEKQERIDRLSPQPGRVSYRQLQLDDSDDVHRRIVEVLEEYGRLDGILHMAGAIADGFLRGKTRAEFDAVLRPKVAGTYNLDRATEHVALDFFMLFSSINSAIGNPGQADYAAANGFLDHFAAYRNSLVSTRQRSGRTRAIHWPLWQDGGMRIDPATRELQRQTTGIEAMRTSTGVSAFYSSLASPHDRMLVAEGDRSKIVDYLQRAGLLPAAVRAGGSRLEGVNAESKAFDRDQLHQQLKTILAQVLRVEAASIDIDRAFVELGLDSFLGAETMVAVNREYGTSLSHIKLYDYPTVRELALLLEQQATRLPLDAHATLRAASPDSTSNRTSSNDGIAIIGMSGRYPQARNLEQYWENLAQGRNAVVVVPSSRWDVERFYHPDRGNKNKTNSKWLGMMDDIDCFDPLFFRISPDEAEHMDPQHRLFLEESYKAFEDAGYCNTTLAGSKCGVYLGITNYEYMLLLSRSGVSSPPITSNSVAIAAARIAYHLDLKGPAISVDTACSSSLVAIHLACQALSSGEIDMALAGGVTLWLSPESYIAMSEAGMFSPVGRCKAFDDTADGMVNAEGVGVLVLKRLKDAEADGDSIYGVVLGSGINQDGKTNGITAPSVSSQIDLERSVYSRYNIDPETITYVETHGTGTRLGDPIELEALATVFGEKTAKTGFCALGSVKSNIGHTTAAAGVAGVHKVLLSLQHRTLVPSLHVTQENSHFNFKGSPFYISREKGFWTPAPGFPRRAAVSSFGFSGTNAHLVVEEYASPSQCEPPVVAPIASKVAILLSARRPEQLKQRARDLLQHLRQQAPSIDLMAIAYTLQIGREAMDERVGFVVDSLQQLTGNLETYVAGKEEIEDVYRGNAKRGKESLEVLNLDQDLRAAIVEKCIAHKNVSRLLDLWVKGIEIEWKQLYSELRPRRVHLPTYPFARERYWIPERNANQAAIPARPIPRAPGEYWKSQDKLLLKVLWRQLHLLGLFDSFELEVAEWTQTVGLPPLYERWLRETLVLLVERGLLNFDGRAYTHSAPVVEEIDAWRLWEHEREHWLHDPDLQANGLLLEATLQALPQILSGKRKATDVMFPGSSMALVEGVYKNNAVADYMNEVLADATVAYIEQRRQTDPELRLRILEIGAGTGGSSAVLLNRLVSCRPHVEEYCYSDISRAFLAHGEEHYGASNPYLTFRLFNVEAHPAEQGIEPEAYDVVIATNALHATKNIRTTLRHVKATLKSDGILLLNEMAEQSLFTHLTFGLLEGWWLYEDEALRIRGCPALSPEVWKKVLEQEGFPSVFFPVKEAQALGQQVIVAENDGGVRDQRQATQPIVRESVRAKPIAMATHREFDSAGLPQRVHDFLVQAVSRLMKVRMEEIDLDMEFSLFGFDSISLAGFSRFLHQQLQLSLEPSVFFASPTIRKLGTFLATEHREALERQFHSWSQPERVALPAQSAPAPRESAKCEEPVESPLSHLSDGVAIIGMSGCFPQAADIEAFWQNLLEGRDCIRAIPNERWGWPSMDSAENGHARRVQWAGLMDGIDEFDPLFFGISPREAELMDPQQRLLMTYVWQALEDAGYAPQSLSGSNTAILVGTINSGYCEVINKSPNRNWGDSATGTVPSIGPNRMSYLLNLHGPSEPIETACSSSLVAIHRACELILSRRCDMAIVGGVNVLVSPESHLSFSNAGMLSEDGRCKTFSAKANGYVRGEGAAMLVLKKLNAAERDGDHIYAVIRGSAENHGGRANSLTAPNPNAQAEVIKAAYAQASIDIRSVGYIEAHGTGTALGDPIEISGLKSAFQDLYRVADAGPVAHAYCGLGSVKTNIGHLELAAGVAGVIKVVLQFRHRTLVKSLHCDEINPYIQLEDTPFYLVRENREWPALYDRQGTELPRRAGVSSFGFGGVNAHVLLEEYVPPQSERRSRLATTGPAVVLLSAKSDERLREQAKRLHAAIGAQGLMDADLEDLAYTLQVGREAMEHRIAMAVGSIAEARAKLQEYLDDKPAIEDFYRGDMKQNKEALAAFKQDEELQEAVVKWIRRGKLSKLLRLWVSGLDFNWTELYPDRKPRRISLPAYPFAKERYWVDTAGAGMLAKAAASPVTMMLHPLLHANTSDLQEQRYSSTFTGEEFFFADHRIRTGGGDAEKVLPGVAYLEMARVAVDLAWPSHLDQDGLEIRNIVWAQPVAVAEGREIHIALFANEEGQIDYEVYSQNKDEQTLHCQGRAVRRRRPPSFAVDVDQLRERIRGGAVDAAGLYAAFEKMGVLYGQTFKSITALEYSHNEVVAQIRPSALPTTPAQYVLHPTVMDGALQSCVVLMDGWSEGLLHPRLPFALDTLRVFSPCDQETFVWARYSPGSGLGDKVLKMDLDVCDRHGTVCVQMRGMSWRLLSQENDPDHHTPHAECLLAAPVWRGGDAGEGDRKSDFAQHHVLMCELLQVDARQLEFLLPGSQCLLLRAGENKNIVQRYNEHALTCFECIQGVLLSRPQGKILFQVVVCGEHEEAVFAGLWGLLKTAALENPLIVGQVVCVPPGTKAEDLGWRLAQEKTRELDSFIKYEDGVRSVLGWQEVPPNGHSPAVGFKDQGVYLITGGLGALGIVFAREILNQTSDARVVLTGRSEWTPEKQLRIDRLPGDPGRVSYRHLPLGDSRDVKQRIDAILEEYGRLDGILHSAGAIADSFILKKTRDEFAAVLEPKVAGTYNLDLATEQVALDFFVLFSSLTSAIGNPGQADYAAANGFLDHFATYRNALVSTRQRSGRTRTIHWPLWQDGGMKVDTTIQQLQRQTTGIEAMRTSTGMRAFYSSLASPHDRMLVAEGNLEHMRRSLLGRPAAAAQTQTAAMNSAGVDLETLRQNAEQYLQKRLSGLLKLPSHAIDPQTALESYGIDSMLAIKLTNELEKTFGSLPKTLFFEYQTLAELAGYFIGQYSKQVEALFVAPGHDQMAKAPPPSLASAAQTFRSSRPSRRTSSMARTDARDPDSIAIIGLSGRYPRRSISTLIGEICARAKTASLRFPGSAGTGGNTSATIARRADSHYSKWGGFIAGVDEFDPLFFNISPKEAEIIDPQERLFLQHAWMAIEDAGYTRASLQVPCEQDMPGQVGVYAGVWFSEYQLFGAESSLLGKRLGVAGSMASIANRVSYTLNLHGPSLTAGHHVFFFLTAIHVACQDLKQGRTSMAIAGGVNVSIHPNKYLVLSALQSISTQGRCQSFGERGDGYIPSEGVGVVVLKRLSAAERDGDHIYGVIRGSALNHGGKTNGYTVPNPQAQVTAITRALSESHTDPRHISYIEAHGTGTSLGDPIEVSALTQAFRQYTQQTEFCLLGSSKSNIGHCESAAGIAGLTKVLLQMQHRQIAPSLHSAQLNPHIDFEKSPFVVNQQLRPWEQPQIDGHSLPRIAGISSFGAGGSNVHLIVEEYPTPDAPLASGSEVLILLSARTAEQLLEKTRDLLEYVRSRSTSLDLISMAYTLQVGREAMEERLCFVANSAAQVAEKMEAYLSSQREMDGFYLGQVKRNKETLSLFNNDVDLQKTVETWIAKKKFSKLLELWSKGLNLDWSLLYGDEKPKRLSLPTYPFSKERYWIPKAKTAGTVERGAQPSGAALFLHPMLHRNTSNLEGQRFTSLFTGEEFFLSDHVVEGQRVLPGVAYLEMARAAIEQAMPEKKHNGTALGLQLRNVVWVQPLRVAAEPVEVHVRLSRSENGEIEYVIYSGEENTSKRVVMNQGRAVPPDLPREGARVDLAGLQSLFQQRALTSAECYEALKEIGLHYGPAHRALEVLYVLTDGRREAQVLAKLKLPEPGANRQSDYVLHPSMMDAALQASIGLMVAGGGRLTPEAWLPFSLERLDILSACPEQAWAWVRYSGSDRQPGETQKVDIDVCDEQGRVCVAFRGLVPRILKREAREEFKVRESAAQTETLTMAAVWEVTTPELNADVPSSTEKLAIVGGSGHEQQALRRRYPQSQIVHLWPTDTIEYMAEQLQAQGPWDHLFWIVPDGRGGNIDGDSPIEGQKQGVLLCFRIVKALLQLGYGTRKLGWTVVTRQVQAIHKEDATDALHASVHGLIGSMAKEYPNWKVRLADIEADREWPLDQILRLTPVPQGDTHVYRQGEWHRHKLVPCEFPALEKSLYRTGGVYVVIGGAGGVGEVYSEYLIRNYGAHVIWIGRRASDPELAMKIERLSLLGPAPEYIQADAANYEQLQRAYQYIQAHYGAIHGVIHSALQLLDRSLWQMDEERFHLTLASKVDTSVCMARVFGREERDFLLFFSSLQSFYKAAGQSNYAAGCTFVDAYAQQLARQWGRPVKVINWGYWGEVGIVATQAHRERMARFGLASIQPEEGMLVLEQLLAYPIPQVAFAKVTGAEEMANLDPGETVHVTRSEVPSLLTMLQTNCADPPPELITERAGEAEFESLLGKLLLAQMDAIGAFSDRPIAQWRRDVGFRDLYVPWLEESFRAMAAQGYIHPAGKGWKLEEGLAIDLPNAWKAWQSWKETTQDSRMAAQTRLVEATLQALPEILLGRRLATEVLFPNSGLELVEGLYKNNALADYFNEALAGILVKYVDERVKRDPATRLRILEIGAGTGGSSASIFKNLAGREEHIQEYAYTDLSKVFIIHADQKYGEELRYLNCRQFDVERPLSEQNIELGSYDVVVAGNVLHATRNIRQTLRNAKLLLKRHGILLLNELTEKRLFVHLTFGLTEGWWRFEDPHLRLQGSPSLSPQGWRLVLLAEGFGPVLFPAHAASVLGQQIVAAESDGLLRQQRAVQPQRPVVSTPATPGRREVRDLRQLMQAFLIQTVSQMMKVKGEDIDLDAELSQFGFDPFTLTTLSSFLNVELQLELMPSLFFQEATLRGLGNYLLDHHGDALGRKFERAESVPAEVTQLPSERRLVPGTIPLARPATETEEDLVARLNSFLIEAVSRLMNIKVEEIDLDTELSLFGFDSISLTGFSNYLNQELQLELMPTVFFENPTLGSLGAYLAAKHQAAVGNKFRFRAQAEESAIAPKAKSVERSVDQASFSGPAPHRGVARDAGDFFDAASRVAMAEPVAIIGISGCFPQAEDIDAFWRNLAEGKDCITALPPGRWEWPESLEDTSKTHIRWGGFIDGVDEFDPLFFSISPREAELMDPQQRLLMAHVWKAIEDAGYSPQSLSGSNTALLVGTGNSGYGIKAQTMIRGDSTTAWVPSIGPNRMSHLLNLHGPSEPVETACSSSLVAIHRGRELVAGGHCDMAIVGGVNTLISPETHVGYARAGLLSEDGRCKTFSAKANGYVRGEGAGMLVLKRLKAAQRDGDHIYGVLRGSAENHGGRSNSLTAPNPRAQAELIKQVYVQAGIDCSTVTYIEAHGTGTALGDPIEIDGLKRAFEELYEATGRGTATSAHCGLGSVKTNIGHLELASGVAGVIKVLLQFRHQTLVKTLHCDEINPYIQLQHSPFYIVGEKQEWRRLRDQHGQEVPYRAGVSSFGFGGVNAHVVLEEYAPLHKERTARRLGAGPAVLVLSAKNEDRLQRQAKRLLAAIAEQGLGDADLEDCAYTLQVGREAMEHRIAMTVGSIKEAQQKLQEFIDGKQAIKDFYRGEVKRNKEALAAFKTDEELREALAKWIQRGKLSKLLELWVKGLEFDWSELYGDERPHRLSLPTYPFARERYWIEASPASPAAGKNSSAGGVAKLHPLLHANTSEFHQQSYTTTFNGEEFFLKDHQVRINGRTMQKVLPAAAYLELARAGMEQAWPSRPESSLLELHDTVWTSPIIVEGKTQISLALSVNEYDQIVYRIYREDGGDQIVHCQGRGEWSQRPAPVKIDLVQIEKQIGQRRLAADEIYAAFISRGFIHGPAFRVITAVTQGSNQSLAQLHLPVAMEKELPDYVLHPSVIDGALQACAGLLDGWSEDIVRPRMPFALDRLSILSRCTREMFVWVRYSAGTRSTGNVLKLDIDLCDKQGNVCVQMCGLASRVIESRIDTNDSDQPNVLFDSSYYERIINEVSNHGITVDEAVELG